MAIGPARYRAPPATVQCMADHILEVDLLALTGRKVLLEGQPWLERSIRVRNPYVDPLNLIQVETFRRLRAASDDHELDLYWRLLRMTIQGVAAGLRTTG